jgi:hypothetical protein
MAMRKLDIFKNVSTNWLSLGINILVGIFLSPFILYRLGNLAYVAWILAFSVTGYYGFFDLGIRSSITRYVSAYTANHDMEALHRLVNTGQAAYSAIGALTMVLTLVVSLYMSFLFRIPANFAVTAKWLFLTVGSVVALGFPVGEGLNRFYITNLTNLHAPDNYGKPTAKSSPAGECDYSVLQHGSADLRVPGLCVCTNFPEFRGHRGQRWVP